MQINWLSSMNMKVQIRGISRFARCTESRPSYLHFTKFNFQYLQGWALPDIPVDLEQIALFVWEANFALLVEASVLEVVCKPAYC